MFSFTLKDLFLNFTDEPSRIYLHKPDLGSLHFFTLHSSVCFSVNLAFVNNRFKFGEILEKCFISETLMKFLVPM